MTEAITPAENTAMTAPVKGADIQAAASFDIMTDEGMKLAYNAGLAADKKVDDCIGQTVQMVGYYIEPVDTVDEKTGEYAVMPHVVLFAADGSTYEGFSQGLYSSVKRLAALCAAAHKEIDAEHPLAVTFETRKAKLGRMFYLKLA